MDLRTSYFLAEAPRPVPLSLRIRLLFGGFGQFGWLVAGFGMIFVWAFAANADYGFVTFRGEKAKTEGKIVRVEKTSASEGGSDHSDGTPIYLYEYAYVGPDGREYTGVAYRTGKGPDEGHAITIEYLKSDPSASRAVGFRRAVFPPFVAFVVIFPVVGLGMVVARWRRGLKGMRLLARGNLALGTLLSKVATNTRVNDRRVYKLTFSYTDADGMTREVVAKTTRPATLEDEEAERVLYDPARPAYAVMMDNLPGKPEVDEWGQFKPAGMRAALLFVAPLVSVVGHGVWAWLR